MRYSYRQQAIADKEAPAGHKWFDLVTSKLDSFKTRLLPSGGRFHSEARPWLDSHNQSSCRHQIGKMVEHTLGVDSKGDDVFQVLVWFDLADPNAAEIYRKHNTLASDGKPLLAGCSVGFLPIRKHIEVPPGSPPCPQCKPGQANQVCRECRGIGYLNAELVYDEWTIMEGSSCPAPSNPTALMRSATDAAFDTFEAVEAKKAVPSHHLHKKGSTMKPEHRAAHRNLIGNSLYCAEDHMRAAADMGDEFPEHRSFHELEARSAMNRACAMTRMVMDSMKAGHEDAPEDAALVGNMVRSAPKNTSEELAKEWDFCQRAALPYADVTFAQAAHQIGAKSPRDLIVQARTNEQIIKLYNTGKAQERKAAQNAEAALCGQLIETLRRSAAGLEPGLECEMLGLDPSDPKRETRSGKPWTSEELRRMVVRLESEAPVVVRPTEVRSVEVEGATPVIPAAKPERPTAAGAPAVDPAVAAFLADSARRTGSNATTMLSVAQKLG